MTHALEYLQLADWRRQVARLYADVRAAPAAGRHIAWHEWRAARNDLFRIHPQSPLAAEQRRAFRGLAYFDYDPAWRITATIEPETGSRRYDYELGRDGRFTMTRIGWAGLESGDLHGRLALYWIEGYGGGLFLPFKDATSGDSTYGGGRYLYDTIKGADLGATRGLLTLDFNYAYNPSCAYHPRWVCPLAPGENTLPLAVPAGEKSFVEFVDSR